MRKKILHNWALKLLSVAIAIVVWVIVVNYDNPYKTTTISGIPIEITNTDIITEQDMTYTVTGSPSATIRVTCRRNVAEQLNTSDFTAVADVNKLYSATNQIPVMVTCSNNKVTSDEITQVTQSLEIELENVITQRMQIQVEALGEPSSGYKVGETVCSPGSVTVKAPASFMDQVSYVGVVVSVDDVSQDVTTTSPLEFYSAGGSVLDTSEVSDLSVSATDITTSVEILNVKTVNLTAAVTGQDAVADGYRYAGLEMDLSSVDICGRKSVLADVSSVSLPEKELDVTGASKDITKTFDLRDCLPEEVSLSDEGNYQITVTLKIEKLATKTFTMDLSNIAVENLDPSLALSDEEVTMSVTVEGLEEDLKNLTEDELSGTIDLSGLGEGVQNVTADIAVPSGFAIVGTVSVQLSLVAAGTGTAETE